MARDPRRPPPRETRRPGVFTTAVFPLLRPARRYVGTAPPDKGGRGFWPYWPMTPDGPGPRNTPPRGLHHRSRSATEAGTSARHPPGKGGRGFWPYWPVTSGGPRPAKHAAPEASHRPHGTLCLADGAGRTRWHAPRTVHSLTLAPRPPVPSLPVNHPACRLWACHLLWTYTKAWQR